MDAPLIFTSDNKGKSTAKPQVVDHNKFTPIDNPLVPRPLAVWSAALANVKRSPEDTRRAPDLGYAFPEPALVIGPQAEEKRARYIVNLIRFRPALIHRLLTMTSTGSAAVPQLWRDLLNLPFDVVPGSLVAGSSSQGSITRSSKGQQAALQFLSDCLASDVQLTLEPIADIRWRGQALSATKPPDTRIIHEILWELSELNFRFEFASLDSRARTSPRSQLTASFEASLPRYDGNDLAQCFPGPNFSISVAEIERSHEGIAAEDWRNRLPFVLAMRAIMEHWVGYDERCFGPKKGCNDLSQVEFDVIEAAVARFYTQCFYDHFWRPAILPRSLPCLS